MKIAIDATPAPPRTLSPSEFITSGRLKDTDYSLAITLPGSTICIEIAGTPYEIQTSDLVLALITAHRQAQETTP